MLTVKRIFDTYRIVFIVLPIIFGLCSCDEEPPVKPVLPDILGCNITGDLSLDYVSKKIALSKLTDFTYQFQFSSIATIDNESYALVISVFPKSTEDTSGVFTIVPRWDNSIKENYAIALFISGYRTNHAKEFWADSGTVELDRMFVGKALNIIHGNFNFYATTADTVEKITVSDGWVDYVRKY